MSCRLDDMHSAAIHKSENKFGLHKSENKFGLHKSENKFGLHKSENEFNPTPPPPTQKRNREVKHYAV